MNKNVLLVLGGTWHDFDGFSHWMVPLTEANGYTMETTTDLGALSHLSSRGYDLVVFYTCLGTSREDGSPAEQVLTDEQAAPLAEWVAGGGALLAIHAATASGQTSPIFRRLVGGVFVEHPPRFVFPVFPLYRDHPITHGVAAFSVSDEFYFELHEPDVDVHMMAMDRGVAYPMAWSRSEGQGRVAHIALGHDAKVWNLPEFRQLVLQAMNWCLA